MTGPSGSIPAPEIHSLAERERPPAGGAQVEPMAMLAGTPPLASPNLACLYAAFKACDGRVMALASEANRLGELTAHVDAPEPLYVRREDPLSIHLAARRSAGGRRFYGFSEVIEDLRRRELVDISGRPCLYDRRRRDEIISAFETWCAALVAARDASGLTIAQADLDAAIAEHVALRDAILAMRADDLDGLLVKAAVVAVYVAEPDDDELASERLLIEHLDRDTTERFPPWNEWRYAAAVLADLARIAETRGLLPDRAKIAPRRAAG